MPSCRCARKEGCYFQQGGVPLAEPPQGSVALRETPDVFFAPCGKLVARWQQEGVRRIVVFDRPGDIVTRRFGVLEIPGLHVGDGKQGCSHLFLTLPFTAGALPHTTFGDALTPSFKEAFMRLMRRGEGADDFWVVRGEPGVFAVAAERHGAVWRVCGITGAARTLTVRLEDLWLRTPEALRALRYTVGILRDPNKNEAGGETGGERGRATVEEAFAQQPFDVRVALDLAENGGFVLTFGPPD